eukprot:gene6363-12864_t
MASFAPVTIRDLKTDEQLKEFTANNKLSVIFFWAEWHEPSKTGGQMDQLYRSLSLKYNNVQFGRIEAEVFPSASEIFAVRVVPTFVSIIGSKLIGKVEGVNPTELNSLLTSLIEMPLEASSVEISPPPAVPANQEERLKRLVNSATVMLFMKGSPDAPRCGFSRKIVDILKQNDIPFASFDILLDNDVREGLKKLYEWPTYPQLYVSGQLMGGLDILTEMASAGNLKEQLCIPEISLLKNNLDDRLRTLINKAPITIFIKGSPDSPKCGFSRTLIQILKEENITFDYFDILSDEEVRQGLKMFSDWPTYPQVYCNGTLIGGLDIVIEMRAAGPLKDQLQLN